MTNDIAAFSAAKKERERVLAEIKAMAALLSSVAEIISKQHPSDWQFERDLPHIEEPSRPEDGYRLEDDALSDPDKNFIDPATWPTIAAMKDLQKRLIDSEGAVRTAYEQFSDDARAEIAAPPWLSKARPNRRYRGSRS